MIPTEIQYYILSYLDGFERENLGLVCKMWRDFRFPKMRKPERYREVRQFRFPYSFYRLFRYGHGDLIKIYLKKPRLYSLLRVIKKACKYGYLDIFEMCLNKFKEMFNIDFPESELYSPMASAIFNKHKDIIRKGIKLLNHTGMLLFYAYKAGDFETIDMISNESRTNNLISNILENLSADYVFRAACISNKLAIVKDLIAKGMVPRCDIFYFVYKNNDPEMMEYFEKMPRSHLRNRYIFLGLIANGNTKLALEMVPNDAEFICRGIKEAIQYDRIDIFNYLINIYDRDLHAILIYCYKYRRMKYMERLVELGVIPTIAELVKDFELVCWAINKGATDFNKAIESACYIGNVEVFEYLTKFSNNYDIYKCAKNACRADCIEILMLMRKMCCEIWKECLAISYDNISLSCIEYISKESVDMKSLLEYCHDHELSIATYVLKNLKTSL